MPHMRRINIFTFNMFSKLFDVVLDFSDTVAVINQSI